MKEAKVVLKHACVRTCPCDIFLEGDKESGVAKVTRSGDGNELEWSAVHISFLDKSNTYFQRFSKDGLWRASNRHTSAQLTYTWNRRHSPPRHQVITAAVKTQSSLNLASLMYLPTL